MSICNNMFQGHSGISCRSLWKCWQYYMCCVSISRIFALKGSTYTLHVYIYIVLGYYIQNHVQNSPKIHIEEVFSSKFVESKVSELLKLKEGPPTGTEVPLLHPIASDRKLLFNQLNFPAHDSCDVS